MPVLQALFLNSGFYSFFNLASFFNVPANNIFYGIELGLCPKI